MRCYFTGEECDCGGEPDTECPHDEMAHDDLEDIDEERFMEMSERLDQCPVAN